jgi:hypothetical protein
VLFQVEERASHIERQQEEALAMLDNAKLCCAAKVQVEADHRQESQQALVEQLAGDMSRLQAATHEKLARLEEACTSSARYGSVELQTWYHAPTEHGLLQVFAAEVDCSNFLVPDLLK